MAPDTTGSTKKPTVAFSVRLPGDLVDLVDDVADKEDRSRNSAIVALLRRAVAATN